MNVKKESEYQAGLIKRIKEEFPGCIVVKNDPNYIQGFPDLTVLYKSNWALLEVKRGKASSRRPNQEYYVEKADAMSIGRFIYPENEKEVLDELHQTWGS